MKIFAVVENFLASDTDGWQWWLDKTIISYHQTEKGALDKIATFPENKEITWESMYDKYTQKTFTYTIECIEILE